MEDPPSLRDSSGSATAPTATTHHHGSSSSSSLDRDRPEPVRSRWTPKPEQILILESIFNSGMVNPPKEETVRIRKLLEKFGAVGDANVFYWFQNRRSRSRRRQRQMQASLQAVEHPPPPQTGSGGCVSGSGSGGGTEFEQKGSGLVVTCTGDSGSVVGGYGQGCGLDDMYGLAGQVGIQQMDQNCSILCPQDPTAHLNYQSGMITVFINGVATEVPGGPFDMKAVFGDDALLVHASGVPVPFHDFGVLLHHGESYFLVPRVS